MKKQLIVYFLIIISLRANAQLERKALFGAQIEYINENGIKGCKVLRVLRGTAQELKLKENDIIQQVGQSSFNSNDEFINEFLTYSPGKEVQLQVLRGKKKMTLKAKAVGRPYETDDNSKVIYDEAAYRGGQLRVIINKPFKEEKMPAMLFIPGYTCSSIDELSNNHPYKRIVDAYVDAGYVTLRIEKSGLGDSKNTPKCESCNLLDEIENFEVGLKKLKSLPYVDTNQVFIFGHSMGGIVAPAISAKHKVAGVVVFGTLAMSWFEYQLEMYRLQNALAGMNPIEVEKSVLEQYDLNYRFFVKKEKLEDIAKDPLADSLLRATWQYDGKGKIYDRNAEYWRQIQDYPLLENWKNTSAKVLVQYGESDFQAFSKAAHEQIVNTVNHFNPGNASIITFPKTDHFFAQSGSMQEAYNKFAEGKYQQLFDEYNFEVGKSAVQWSNSVISKSNESAVTDKGWVKLTTEKYPGKQDDITFINENEGWYVNGYGTIYHTKDAGKSWEKQLEKKGTFFRCIAFIDSLVGFAGTVGTDYFPNVTDTIPLYGTNDGGKTWNPIAYQGPYVKGLCAMDIVKEQFINHGKTDYKIHIYGVGRVGAPANMMVSHDAGKTWTSKSMNDDCKMLFDIKMFNKQTGIACAASDENMEVSNALILKTIDGGKTWKKVFQSNRPFECTWKASFPTEKIGYVTIQSYNPDANVKQQRIAKTTDGGETWQEINLVEDAEAREFGVGFIDENHGFVGTMKSGYETKDGGKTWSPINLGRACNKIRIYKDAKGKIYGYAIGVDVMKGIF
jgi:photosystem II stability/assembly factor-like uncharacterized protein/pimeloyl-ACP methyl ester carboxylesterase